MTTIHIISWQLTRKCNLACEYCYTSSLPTLNTSSELSTKECLSLLKRLKNTTGISSEAMLIITGGEPFLRKDIFKILSKASENFFVVVGTNGIPLTKNKVTLLKKLVKGVSINLDYINIKSEFEFPELKKAIINKMETVRLLNDQDVPFIINTTLHKGNISQLDAIAEFSKTNGAQSLNLFSLVPLGRGHDIYGINNTIYEHIIDKVLEIKERYKNKLKIITKCAPYVNARLFLENPESIRIFEGSGGCPAGKSYMYISAEGEILPCPYFPLDVSAGNIRKDELEDAITSEIFKRLDQRELKGKCGDCEFSYLCSGCRARAYIINGDYLQTDPLCNYIPKGGAKVDEKTIIEKGGIVYAIKEKKGGVEKMTWSEEARLRIEKVPFFVRSFVKNKIELKAIEMGAEIITPQLMDIIKKEISPMHGSKRYGNLKIKK